jgi:transposase
MCQSRAETVLLRADGVGTNEIMHQTGKSKTSVWRWQKRFMQEGYGGLLRDKTRPSTRLAPSWAQARQLSFWNVRKRNAEKLRQIKPGQA